MKLWIDPSLSAISPQSLPSNWATRATFCHPRASELWLRATTEPDALESHREIVSMYASMLNGLEGDWRYFISVGAGSGVADKFIIWNMRARSLQYLPIDLSPSMCRLAAQNVKAVCPVPLAIAGDFEGAFTQFQNVFEQLDEGKRLISCTSTVGNLDLGELNFFKAVSFLMVGGDYLLFSIGTGAFVEPLTRDTFDKNVGWRDLRGLLAGGISMITGENIGVVERELDQRIDVRKGKSDIPHTSSVELWDRKSGRGLLHLRRYDLTAVRRWIEEFTSLRIVRIEETRLPHVEVGMGAFLLIRD